MIILHINFHDGSETYRTAWRCDIHRDSKEFYIWYSNKTGKPDHDIPDEKVGAARIDVYIPGMARVLHTYIM